MMTWRAVSEEADSIANSEIADVCLEGALLCNRPISCSMRGASERDIPFTGERGPLVTGDASMVALLETHHAGWGCAAMS
eukprot:3982428-Pleurochrysis_carterae.AAC.2